MRQLQRKNVNGLSSLPFTPSYDFETFSTTFEDPFSYSAPRPYEAVGPDPESFNEAASPQELDNKLLGFSTPIVKATVVDEATGQLAEPAMAAELFGMFFVAEDVYTAENTGRPLELTCYRRNLWQCSGQVTLPRHVGHVVDEQGLQLPVVELAASITAIESIEGKPTEIISIPWKSANPNNNGGNVSLPEESKVAGAPPHVPVDLSSGQDVDGSSRVTVPVSWKRLQFKHATANNGRRKGLQQHYVVQINLLAKLKSGELLKIAEIQSGPVIVRGRSPRNFDSRRDVPLTGDKKLERRTASGESGPAAVSGGGGVGGGSSGSSNVASQAAAADPGRPRAEPAEIPLSREHPGTAERGPFELLFPIPSCAKLACYSSNPAATGPLLLPTRRTRRARIRPRRWPSRQT